MASEINSAGVGGCGSGRRRGGDGRPLGGGDDGGGGGGLSGDESGEASAPVTSMISAVSGGTGSVRKAIETWRALGAAECGAVKGRASAGGGAAAGASDGAVSGRAVIALCRS